MDEENNMHKIPTELVDDIVSLNKIMELFVVTEWYVEGVI